MKGKEPGAPATDNSGPKETPGRSLRSDVRNPLLAMPAMEKLRDLSPEQRSALKALLREVAKDARFRAEKCWRTHKAPMAAYWKAVSVYAGHTARALS